MTRINSAGMPSRTKTTPIPVQRTVRPHPVRVLTSFEPGKMIPVSVIPLLREDSVTGAAIKLVFEMKETVEVLMNGVSARVLTYLVPKTAFERFHGMDHINKAYKGEPLIEGEAVTPWFETMAAPATHGSNAVLKALGKHARPGTTINTDYIEAYNLIWNTRATNRSPDITPRARLDATLAPAFWTHEQFAHIVPDFDQATVDGEVPLNVVNERLTVKGISAWTGSPANSVTTAGQFVGPDGLVPAGVAHQQIGKSTGGNGMLAVKMTGTGVPSSTNLPDVWAELAQNGITVSLSNIEMARKTQAFAELRRQYTGHSDEYIIDLLMDGISVPELSWEFPILLADMTTQFGMSKRYASDGANLTESVVNGLTTLEQRFSCPRVPMGGVIMTVVEVMPEQLFERQKDPYMHATNVDTDLPAFLRDTLDPEKVVVVKNEEIDLDHATPASLFGYAPLNHQWMRGIPCIGGKFYRPEVDASFDEDRQRIWAVETQNPVLSEDFYLCTAMHQKPFVETTGDNFELLVRGECAIVGNTVFGGQLIEASNDYEAVAAKQPTDRLDKE